MVEVGVTKCPKCNGGLRYRNRVKRMVRNSNKKYWIEIQVMRCKNCGSYHREIPDSIYPYKQYERNIIDGVRNGTITSELLEYEDYPCELTMQVWIREKNTLYYERN